jgi:NADH dehydrogenase
MILVTGGTGFIGKQLIQTLVDSGRQVRVLLKPSKISPNFPKGISVEVAVSSLTDEKNLRAALKGVEQIYHLAGVERYGQKGNLNQVEVEGTRTLLRAAKNMPVSRLIYVSHLGADRGSAYPVFKAKGIAENEIINSGIPYTILRVSALFGEGDQFTLPLKKLLRISPGFFLLPAGGENLLQPLWIKDFVTCLQLTLDDVTKINRVISLGGIETFTYREIVQILMSYSGIKRFLIKVSPQFLRTLTLLIDGIYPRFPVSIFWLDQIAENRITALDTVPREFGLMPSRFKNQLEYLKK